MRREAQSMYDAMSYKRTLKQADQSSQAALRLDKLMVSHRNCGWLQPVVSGDHDQLDCAYHRVCEKKQRDTISQSVRDPARVALNVAQVVQQCCSAFMCAAGVVQSS